MTSIELSNIDYISLAIFLACWFGYTRFAIWRSRSIPTLSSELDALRLTWMRNATKPTRIAQSHDVLSIGVFERSVAFFASTSMLILAGLLTMLGATEKVSSVLSSLSFSVNTSNAVIQLKVILLIFLFVYAFFKFCWAMRCYSFLVTLMGASPFFENEENNTGNDTNITNTDKWIRRSASTLSIAAHHFNLGLRGYYFSLAVLAWFIHPVWFIIASIAVVLVLYRRDFKSTVLGNLQAVSQIKTD